MLCGVVYKSITKDGDICLGYERNGAHQNLIAEQVLVATGHRPNSDDLGLEKMGVKLLPNGGIKVDGRMRTTRTDVYAAGDVTGRDMFVYMAANGAKIASENALNGDSQQYDNSAMPEVVFTDPQVATVCLTEVAAREDGYSVKTSVLGGEIAWLRNKRGRLDGMWNN